MPLHSGCLTDPKIGHVPFRAAISRDCLEWDHLRIQRDEMYVDESDLFASIRVLQLSMRQWGVSGLATAELLGRHGAESRK